MLLAAVALVYLSAVIWKSTSRRPWLVAAWGGVAAAAAIRPDLVVVLVLGAMGLTLLIDPTRSNVQWTALAAAIAVTLAAAALFVLGNLNITGSPFTPPVYLLETLPEAGISGRDLPQGIGQLVSLLLPNGAPELSNVGIQARKYFWEMGPVWLLTLGALAAVAQAFRRRRASHDRVGLTHGFGLVALAVYFFVSRVSTTNWGADETVASIGHSLPRYVALIFAVMGVMVVREVALSERSGTVLFATTGLAALSILGALYLFNGETRVSYIDAVPLIETYEEYANAVDDELPDEAVLYVRFADKFLWSVRPMAVLPTEGGADKPTLRSDELVQSLIRGHTEGYRLYVMELTEDEANEVSHLLAAAGLTLTEVSVGETPRVNDLLLRWKSWEVVEHD